MTDGVGYVELEFERDDVADPGIRISDRLDCHLDLLCATRETTDTTTGYYLVADCDPERVIEVGTGLPDCEAIGIVDRFENDCVVKITTTHSVLDPLHDTQVPMQSLEIEDGSARFIATVPPSTPPSAVIASVQQAFPSVTLVRKQPTRFAHPFTTPTEILSVLEDRLTQRQWDALTRAFEEGYFERPRQTTQADLAAQAGVSPSTFAQHLHTALRKLLRTVFGAPDRNDDRR